MQKTILWLPGRKGRGMEKLGDWDLYTHIAMYETDD